MLAEISLLRGSWRRAGACCVGPGRGIGHRRCSDIANRFLSGHLDIILLRLFLGAFGTAAGGKRERSGGDENHGSEFLHR